MSDVPPEQRPVLPPERDAGQPAPRRRLAERVWPLSTLVAVALGALILGGLGGATVANLTDDDGVGSRGHMGEQLVQRGGPHGMPPGQMKKHDPERYQQWKEQRGQGLNDD